MKAYGITTAAPAAANGAPLEELSRNGFTVLDAALPPDTVATMRDALDRLVAAQAERVGGTARLAAMGEAGQARALLEEEPVFLDILRVAPLEAVVTATLGPAAHVMQQNGIVMPPEGAEHHQQSWHRDLPYQSWVATKPLALGALTVLDDFTAESGATLFLPGSQMHADFPTEAFARRWAVPAYASAGSIVIFDAMCFHRGGVNRGRAPRRAVNTLYGVPLLAQQVAFTDKPGLDANTRRRLGLDYQPAPSTDSWRERRAARLNLPR